MTDFSASNWDRAIIHMKTEKALLENPIGHALVYLVLFYFSGIHAYPDIVWIL